MKKKWKYILIIAIIAIILTGRNAMEIVKAEDRKPLSEMIVATYDVDSIKIDDEAEVLVVVQGNNEEVNTTGKLFVYTRSRGEDGKFTSWKDALVGADVKMGKKGMGKQKEGDGKTPVGMYSLNTPFGIKDAKEGFPENYLKVTEDLYWNGDSSSATYNKLVSTSDGPTFNPKDSEHLIDISPQYAYCLNVSYNSDCSPGAGSAIFLHCFGTDRPNTGGCIAMDEDDMIRVLQLYREGKTRILIDNGGCFTKYY